MTTEAAFWETRWQNGQTGWDLGAPSPPLLRYADQIPPERRHLRLLMPGCGNGYEALYLLEAGFTDITMLDIAPSAVEALRARLQKSVPGWEKHLRLVCGNFFQFSGSFDLVLEQTFFCALDPAFRNEYAGKMHELLTPDGKIAGVLFDKDFDGGPPFGGHAEEYRQLFTPFFQVKIMAPCFNSIPPRAGSELFIVLEKR